MLNLFVTQRNCKLLVAITVSQCVITLSGSQFMCVCVCVCVCAQRRSDRNVSSGSEDEEFASFLQKHPQRRSSSDEALTTAAKEKGKGLYANLAFQERKDKLEALVGVG